MIRVALLTVRICIWLYIINLRIRIVLINVDSNWHWSWRWWIIIILYWHKLIIIHRTIIVIIGLLRNKWSLMNVWWHIDSLSILIRSIHNPFATKIASNCNYDYDHNDDCSRNGSCSSVSIICIIPTATEYKFKQIMIIACLMIPQFHRQSTKDQP